MCFEEVGYALRGYNMLRATHRSFSEVELGLGIESRRKETKDSLQAKSDKDIAQQRDCRRLSARATAASSALRTHDSQNLNSAHHSSSR
jgi:hypothetical protein